MEDKTQGEEEGETHVGDVGVIEDGAEDNLVRAVAACDGERKTGEGEHEHDGGNSGGEERCGTHVFCQLRGAEGVRGFLSLGGIEDRKRS
jgi:hypothetical protein